MSNKTQRFSVDLERNEDWAKLAADVEPGDKLEATVSVVSKDDKTLVIELEEVEEPGGRDDDKEEKDEKDDEKDDSSDDTDDEASPFPALQVMKGKG